MHGHWSAVRRIIDGRPPHSLVLRIASVLPGDAAVQPRPADRTPAPPTTPKASTTSTLLLTDGWHGISAAVDPDLQELVMKGIIRPGTTLLVCAATLEATVPPRLSLYYNSTFRWACGAVESVTHVDSASLWASPCCNPLPWARNWSSLSYDSSANFSVLPWEAHQSAPLMLGQGARRQPAGVLTTGASPRAARSDAPQRRQCPGNRARRAPQVPGTAHGIRGRGGDAGNTDAGCS